MLPAIDQNFFSVIAFELPFLHVEARVTFNQPVAGPVLLDKWFPLIFLLFLELHFTVVVQEDILVRFSVAHCLKVYEGLAD